MSFIGCFPLSLRLLSPSASKLSVPFYSSESHWFEHFFHMYIVGKKKKKDMKCLAFLHRDSVFATAQNVFRIEGGNEKFTDH